MIKLMLSGTEIVIDGDRDPISLQIDDREPEYMSLNEARLLSLAITTIVEQIEEYKSTK